MDVSLPAEAAPISRASANAERLMLWNPRAATCWGLLLSPAFSAYIHMRNWQALGQEDKAAEARTWLRLLIGIVVASCFLPALGNMLGHDLELPASTGLVLLLAWHVWGGRGQERYIAAITGGAYVRRRWSGTILSALCVFGAIVLTSAALSLIIIP